MASGNIGSENRTKPYVPIFRSTAARMTEPAVGASTCASGSHVWNGNIGTLIAKPKKKAKKIQICSFGGMQAADRGQLLDRERGGLPRPLCRGMPPALKK